jgi:hypothetical protein
VDAEATATAPDAVADLGVDGTITAFVSSWPPLRGTDGTEESVEGTDNADSCDDDNDGNEPPPFPVIVIDCGDPFIRTSGSGTALPLICGDRTGVR